jgi:phytoene desaturase
MSDSNKKAIIIGAGIGGISLAALLAKKGYVVEVFEKNATIGGRARVVSEAGYTFDMGPSWYMMPDVFEEFFTLLGEDIHQYLKLQKLSPSYRVFLSSTDAHHDFYADRILNKKIFDAIEPGAGDKLNAYLDESKRQYKIAKHEFIYKNYNSVFDFFNKRVMREGRKLELFNNMERIISRTFSSELLRKVMMFQMVLLGTAPKDAPGMYRLMNHVDFDLGIWYPKEGIGELPKAIGAIATKHGATFHCNAPVRRIITQSGQAIGVELDNGTVHRADLVISNADLHHTEMNLLEPHERDHSERYWNKRTLAPSAFILYLGVRKQFDSLSHHNLMFSKDWDKNFKEIFNHDSFPSDPSIYVCAPSKTDPSVAPKGHENLFVLVPIAAGIEDNETNRTLWTEHTLSLLESKMGMKGLREHITYQKSYSVSNFTADYNSFIGTALGLAHTLTQSALWRPNNVSKKVKNLYFVGAYNNPGIGMPICVVSAQNTYKRIEQITDPHPLTSLQPAFVPQHKEE